MKKVSWFGVSRSGAGAILVLLVGAHVGVVSSILWQSRPLIWPLHNDTMHRVGRAADFYAVYHAGLNLRQGLDPYANNADGVTPYWYPYRYLPVVAAVFQPLTFLSPRAAYLAWVLALEGLLAALLVTLWRRIPERGIRLAAVGLLLFSSPYFLELYMGQFTFASIALCSLGLLLPAGPVLYAASALLKPLTLAGLPALASERRYWWHGACTLLCVLLVSVPYFWLHPEQWSVFFNANFRLKGGLDAGNYGLVRVLQLAFEDLRLPLTIADWTRYTGWFRLLLLAGTSLLVLHARRASTVVGVAALLLAHFLTYQHVWEHHMSGVCVLGAVLLTTRDLGTPARVAILLSLALLSAPTLFGVFDGAKDAAVWDPSGAWPRPALYAIVLPKVLPTVILYAVAAGSLFRGGLMSPVAAWRRILGDVGIGIW
jgi:hypothetical protein